MLYPFLSQTVPDLLASPGAPAGSAFDISWWQKYGPLGVGIVVFGGVIMYLFKLMRADQLTLATAQLALAAERATWAVEREKIRTEFEAKHVALSEQYAQALVAEMETNRTNDNEIRREHAERFEAVAANQQRNYDQMIAIMNKLTDPGRTRPR